MIELRYPVRRIQSRISGSVVLLSRSTHPMRPQPSTLFASSHRWRSELGIPLLIATAAYSVNSSWAPNDLQLWKLLKWREVESGLGEEAAEQARPVLHPPEPGPDQRGQLIDVLLDQVGQRPFQVRPDRLDRVQFRRVRRQPEDRQPVPGGDQLAHRAADVGVQAVPDQ